MTNGVGYSEAVRLKHNNSKIQQQSLRTNNSLIQDSIMSSAYSGDTTNIKDYASKYDMSFIQTNPLGALK